MYQCAFTVVEGRLWYSSHSDKAALECGREHSSCTGLKRPWLTHNCPWNPGTQKEGTLDSARCGAKTQDMIIQTSRPESQFHDLLTCVTLGKSPNLPKSQFPHQWNGTPHHKDEGNNSSKSKHYARCLAQNKNSMKICHHPHSHHYPIRPRGDIRSYWGTQEGHLTQLP